MLEENNSKISIINELKDWAITIGTALIISLLIIHFIQTTIVSGNSMYPTLNDKDFLLASKTSYETNMPKPGEIIIFHSKLPEDILIKRVIASEGDKIVIKEGKVWVNDELLNEPYINQNEPYTSGNIEMIVPKGNVFVMGDNRMHSGDSRLQIVGTVSKESIIGKVFVRLYPLNLIQKF